MNDAIGKALQAMARSTTPGELEARGVQRLRSIPLSQVSRMLEIALDQALSEHRAELSEGERAQLVEGAEGRLHALLATQRRLADAAERRREAQVGVEPEAREVASFDEVHARVAELLDGPDSDRAGGDRTELRSAVEAVVERAREREAQLERRIAKLLRAVDETEAALRSARACFDTAHNYRSHALPGLEEGDPRRDQKLSMLEDVARENRGLRRGR
jgi:hypothetical protein